MAWGTPAEPCHSAAACLHAEPTGTVYALGWERQGVSFAVDKTAAWRPRLLGVRAHALLLA